MTVLVTDATGPIARAVLKRLPESGEHVRVLVPRAEAAAGLPSGVEAVEGDLTRPDTLSAAFLSVEQVLLSGLSGVDAATAREVVDLAEKGGVLRVVGLAPPGVGLLPEQAPRARGHLAVEQAVEDSVVEWTHLRPAPLMADALDWAESVHAESVVRAPYGDSARPCVDEADVAAAAVATLLEDGHTWAAYTLTGPAPVGQAEQARLIGQAIGREVAFEELTEEQARERWRGEGRGEERIDRDLAVLAACAGAPVAADPAVERILGRPARTFTQWATHHAGAFG